MDAFADRHKGKKIDAVVGVDARGFIFAGAVAYKLGVGFVPVRKKGKLPYQTVVTSYTLEYGSETSEMHVDAIKKGGNVVIVDDLLATGGNGDGSGDARPASRGQYHRDRFLDRTEFSQRP